MNTARKLNKILEKRSYIMIATGLSLGFFFPDFFIASKPIVPWAFALFTLILALRTSLQDLKRVFSSPIPLVLILLSIHLLSPIFAYFLGKVSFGLDSPLFAGLILFASIPAGVSSTLWVSLAGGFVPLALTAVTVDSLLSPIMIPFTISLFLNKSVNFNALTLITGLFQMVVIPTIVGMIIHEFKKESIEKTDLWWMGLYSKLFLGFIVAVNIATTQANIFSSGVALTFLVVFTLICFNLTLGYGIARLMGYSTEVNRAFVFTVGLRNSGAGIAIALNYFPPEVAFPLITAIMLQQPIASVLLPILNKLKKTSV